MPVGQRLHQARLDAALSLDQVAERTKIQHWILEAIERDDLSRVPGGIFARGYLASFARAVGLDPHEIVTAQFGQEPVPIVLPIVPEPSAQSHETSPWQIAIIGVSAVVLAITWWIRTRPTPEVTTARNAPPASALSTAAPRPVPQAEPTTSGLEPQEPRPAATAGATASSSPVDQRDQNRPVAAPLDVMIHPTREVWIEATADGERKAYQLFKDGENLRLDARQQIHVVIGDAGGISWTINGKPAKSLGGPGIVRVVTLTPDTTNAYTAP